MTFFFAQALIKSTAKFVIKQFKKSSKFYQGKWELYVSKFIGSFLEHKAADKWSNFLQMGILEFFTTSLSIYLYVAVWYLAKSPCS